ncbi:helix-turn-helix transcriptional regulator [Solirubrobacter soli]|uniref:helix-turn-helix transcriptional regulator n=1 Tax=Solirubrobacter soli TaxID=363832 RepID=UPI00069DF001|nr:LuxR family transcriptional regulator [Solirubrobacter soli]
MAEPLVGRVAELAALEDALTEARRGFVALEVLGEPGMGKTRLLAELEQRADGRGCLVLTGSASELERDLPFGVFVDALDEFLYGLDPHRLANLDETTRDELAHIFPSLDRPSGGNGVDERYRLHRAARALLEELAPLVLILDDLHWADSGSLELLGSLLRRPPAAPVLLALAVRPRQVPERLVGVLERVRQVELGELTADEARELVGEHADRLYPAAGGNPFYLQQLARAPARLATGPAVPLSGVEVPRAVAAAFAGEIAQLSDTARQVLAGAAVAGDPFEPELAAIAAGVSEWDAIDALDELLRSDLVRHTDVPRRFRFRHPLVRAAVYATALGGWRLVAHERCATALKERGASALERAHHVERSARRGDSAAVAVLREAGAAAAPRAPASAARLYEAAARLLGPTAPERAAVLGDLARAHWGAGQWFPAYEAIHEAVTLAPSVRAIAAAASLEHLLGRNQEAHARLEAALAGLPGGVSEDTVLLMIELGRDGLYRRDYAAMLAWMRRALDAARELGDTSLLATATGAVTLAATFAGDGAQARAAADEAAALSDALPDSELAQHLDFAANGLAGAELLLDRLATAAARAERGLYVARATGQGQVLPVLFWTATVRADAGRLREAGELLDEAIEMARVAGQAQGLAWNLFARSFVATAMGDTALALATARESVAVLRDAEPSFPASGAGHALAAALLADGDAPGALAALLEAGGGESLPLIPAGWRPRALELHTRILLALGRLEEAARVAAAAQTLAEQLGVRTAGAYADRAAAAVALAGTDDAGAAPHAAAPDDAGPARAAQLALRSAAAFDELGVPVEAALSRALAGRALAGSDASRAAAELDKAAGAFERCGALGRRDACERELRRLGRRTTYRRTKAAGDGSLVGSLTERELQIARLVVDRRTNAEIAAELYLSTKTVETHLRNLFHKLGVSSRVEVARVVEREDKGVRPV